MLVVAIFGCAYKSEGVMLVVAVAVVVAVTNHDQSSSVLTSVTTSHPKGS